MKKVHKKYRGPARSLTVPFHLFVRSFSQNRRASQTQHPAPKRTTAMCSAGFTLVETLVAISILVVAVAAPLTLASQSLFAALYAKDQTTAFYLAQEATEMVRNKRDQNLLAYLENGTTEWLNGIPVNNDFHIDVPNDTMAACTGDCLNTKLLHNGAFYNHATGEGTRFGRSVRVTPSDSDPNEATITVVIEWQTGSFQARTFTLEGRIYNWIPG